MQFQTSGCSQGGRFLLLKIKRKSSENFLKNFKKGIDKAKVWWYNIKAVAQKEWRITEGRAANMQVFAELTEGEFGLWKLNNKERSTKQSTRGNSSECVKYDLAILKENTTQTKVKRAIKLERLDRAGRCVLIQIFREFDPGSGWTLAACITHSSRTKHWR